MKLGEKSVINAPPKNIWPYIVTPEYFQVWNDKIVSMEAKGTFVVGQPYITHYKLTKQSSQCMSTVTELRPMQLLEIKHTAMISSKGPNNMEVTERITLTPAGTRTLVTKEVWIKNHDVPWFLLPIIWFVTRFGKQSCEDKLKTMCERP